ncbi:7-carboxy-7-deazaguanine synthase [Sansalvadorimonas sp. 2012CJ34-2]|uniref:7-carboxy-7-deazaguanine synthase n=1 Tax=Parendozoicomonas callyspongiae TaxID=2942213 RepID=A0ABT0PKC1_9GAMM|nr:7-carboxy-7-deazaguanine synthase [Sansalvadorimonas sp. 2012CJ34-2]MCL6271834.1 7-carboxy-7-deazaguanine synthase [Sansalvadorimonas sp. 2012CJ34-2]
MYSVKEIFYTLQGEGANVGRPAVFCRFSGCNLWSGREQDRATAICNFCDTDFRGTDGEGGGKFTTADELASAVRARWPSEYSDNQSKPLVVCTGGEPLLQMDKALIDSLHNAGFEIAIETNGTKPIPDGIDWSVVSPKGTAEVVVTECDELKLVYPQPEAMPEQFEHIRASHYYLSPMADPHRESADLLYRDCGTQQAIQYCLDHPRWRLNLQTHKVINIP